MNGSLISLTPFNNAVISLEILLRADMIDVVRVPEYKYYSDDLPEFMTASFIFFSHETPFVLNLLPNEEMGAKEIQSMLCAMQTYRVEILALHDKYKFDTILELFDYLPRGTIDRGSMLDHGEPD